MQALRQNSGIPSVQQEPGLGSKSAAIGTVVVRQKPKADRGATAMSAAVVSVGSKKPGGKRARRPPRLTWLSLGRMGLGPCVRQQLVGCGDG